MKYKTEPLSHFNFDGNEYVHNEVFKYQLTFSFRKEVNVYTKPFVYPEDLSMHDALAFDEGIEDYVRGKYFTKEVIEKLKEELISYIKQKDNPFNIECIDSDGDYAVTEEQLFNVDDETKQI